MAPNRQTSASRFEAASVGMCLETLLADRSTNSPADFARVAEAAAAAGFRTAAVWPGRGWPEAVDRRVGVASQAPERAIPVSTATVAAANTSTRRR